MQGRERQGEELLERARQGDTQALGELLELQRARLQRMVALRLDPLLRDRLGSSDIVQETFAEALVRFPAYAREPRLPFLVWLRFLAAQRLLHERRFHLRAAARDARLERRQDDDTRPCLPPADTRSAAQLFAREESTPTRVAARAEREQVIAEALAALDPIDREVLVLRHFEELSGEEAALELGIRPDAAAKRYQRALGRLRHALRGTSTAEGSR